MKAKRTAEQPFSGQFSRSFDRPILQQTHLPHRELISLQSGVDGGDSAVGYGGGDLADLLDPDVTCGVHTGDGGLHFLVGDDIAVLERELTIHLGVGGHTGVHKDAAAGVLDRLNGAVLLTGDFQPLYLVLAVDSVEAGAQLQGDVARSSHLLSELGDTAQLVLKVDDGQLAGKRGQIP